MHRCRWIRITVSLAPVMIGGLSAKAAAPPQIRIAQVAPGSPANRKPTLPLRSSIGRKAAVATRCI